MNERVSVEECRESIMMWMDDTLVIPSYLFIYSVGHDQCRCLLTDLGLMFIAWLHRTEVKLQLSPL